MLGRKSRNDGYWNQSKRFLRYKLVVPMKRSPHPPEYTARGVAVGVFWGLTPLVGVQMPIVTAMWLLGRLHPKTDFALVPGLAWVWTSNVFTMGPMYYAFYITGQLMLGRWDELTGYSSFAKLFKFSAWERDNMWDTLVTYLSYVWEHFGLPMAIGWIPYALVFGWIGYKVSVKLIRERRQRILEKRLSRARDKVEDGGAASGPAL